MNMYFLNKCMFLVLVYWMWNIDIEIYAHTGIWRDQHHAISRNLLIQHYIIRSSINLKTHATLFVVVNFDALAQASDIRIERRQVVFLFWMQDSNPSGSQTPNRQQTECPLTNRLSYRGSSKTWTRQPVLMISEHSAHSTPLPFGIRPWLWRYTYLLLLISMLWQCRGHLPQQHRCCKHKL